MKKMFYVLILSCIFISNVYAKKVAFIIAESNFQEVELFNPVDIVNQSKIKYDIIGIKKGMIKGDNGGFVNVDININEMKDEDYLAIVVIGGSGGPNSLWENKLLKEKIIKFNKENKIVAGICSGSVAIAKSGILEGKSATTYSDKNFKGFIEELNNNNVKFKNKNIVREGNILTSNSPVGSIDFGKKLVEMINKNNL